MKRRILVVEDNEGVRNTLKAMLESFELEVVMAVNGAEGLNFLKKEEGKVALVLSDVDMPKMNGLEMLKQIRRLWPDLLVVMMSGDKDLHVNEAMGLGADDFLAKPIGLKELKKIISALLGIGKENKT